VDCRPAAARFAEGELCAPDADPGLARSDALSYRTPAKPESGGEPPPEISGTSQPQAQLGGFRRVGRVRTPDAGGHHCRTRQSEQLAQLARGRWKSKTAEWAQALAGRVRDHHRFLLAEYLDEGEALGQRIQRMEAEIDQRIRPFETAVALWQTIPGLDRVTACHLVSEIGVDRHHFPTAQHLASWAAWCPGHHESAGKRKSGQTRAGNKWLRRTLCQAAWAVTRKKNCDLATQFKRLAARRGVKRAAIAVAHSILLIGYPLLKTGQSYQELGGNYREQIHKDQLQRYDSKR